MNEENMTVIISLTKTELEACKTYADLLNLVEAYVGSASEAAIEGALQRYPNLAEAK